MRLLEISFTTQGANDNARSIIHRTIREPPTHEFIIEHTSVDGTFTGFKGLDKNEVVSAIPLLADYDGLKLHGFDFAKHKFEEVVTLKARLVAALNSNKSFHLKKELWEILLPSVQNCGISMSAQLVFLFDALEMHHCLWAVVQACKAEFTYITSGTDSIWRNISGAGEYNWLARARKSFGAAYYSSTSYNKYFETCVADIAAICGSTVHADAIDTLKSAKVRVTFVVRGQWLKTGDRQKVILKDAVLSQNIPPTSVDGPVDIETNAFEIALGFGAFRRTRPSSPSSDSESEAQEEFAVPTFVGELAVLTKPERDVPLVVNDSFSKAADLNHDDVLSTLGFLKTLKDPHTVFSTQWSVSNLWSSPQLLTEGLNRASLHCLMLTVGLMPNGPLKVLHNIKPCSTINVSTADGVFCVDLTSCGPAEHARVADLEANRCDTLTTKEVCESIDGCTYRSGSLTDALTGIDASKASGRCVQI